MFHHFLRLKFYFINHSTNYINFLVPFSVQKKSCPENLSLIVDKDKHSRKQKKQREMNLNGLRNHFIIYMKDRKICLCILPPIKNKSLDMIISFHCDETGH